MAMVKTVCSDILETIGRIDILVNNAGLALGLAPYQDYEELDMLTMLDTNVKGLMAVTRCFLPAMVKANQGHIINIVSMAGLIATGKSSLYSATKFAAIGFSNALRLELMPYGVYVTTVNPGPIRTGFFDQADPDGTYLKSVERFLLEPDAVAKKDCQDYRKKQTRNLIFLFC